jgi:hypothetical protein
MATEIITLTDGSKFRVPAGLSDDEALNMVAKAAPEKLIEYGIGYDLEKEYDIRSGVASAAARWGNALAAGDPREVKAEMDNIFGAGNWGLSEIGNQPYVTPEGLRRIGEEPTSNRKVLLDGTDTELYDLVDAAPELIVGTAAVAAELIPIPGTSVIGGTAARGALSALTGRGLVARSIRAGAGDAAANVGLEGVQQLRGTNREGIGEILQEAGTEGLVVGLGSIALGAPFAAVGPVANRIRSAARELPSSQQGISPVQVEDIKNAYRRASEAVGDEDAFLGTIKTLVGDEGNVLGVLAAKLEGAGAKQSGDKYYQEMIGFLNKYKAIVLESKLNGDTLPMEVSRLKQALSEKELALGKKLIDDIGNFKNTPVGQLSEAGKTIKGMRDFARDRLEVQYKAGQRAFSGPEYYGSPILSGEAVTLKNNTTASFLNKLVSSSTMEMSADDILDMMPTQLRSRLGSRVSVNNNGRFVPKKSKGTGSDISVKDFMGASKTFRGQAQKVANYSDKASLVDVAKNMVDTAATVPGISRDFKTKLTEVNKAYSSFIQPYRGSKTTKGLWKSLIEKPTNEADNFLKSVSTGKYGAEVQTIFDDLEAAFGPNAVGGTLGLNTKDEILGSIGTNYIRESKIDITQAFEQGLDEARKEAKRIYKELGTIETTLMKAFDKNTKKAVKSLFGTDTFDEYRSLLKRIENGTPEQALKSNETLKTMLSFREAEKFVDDASKVATNLKNANLDQVAEQVRMLRNLDPRSAEFYQDLMFHENWTSLIAAGSKATGPEKNAAIKAWADDWIAGRSSTNGVENMQEIFGKEMFSGMDDLALAVRGAVNIDPVAGALSVAEVPMTLSRKVIQLLTTGAAKGITKPLSFMLFTRSLAPGSESWKKMVKELSQPGVSTEDVLKNSTSRATEIAKKTQGIADKILTGRNGLLAASVSSYMEEANQTYPTQEEVPPVLPKKIDEQQAVEVSPTPTQQNQDIANSLSKSIMDLISSAQSVQGVGTGALEEGAAIAGNR